MTRGLGAAEVILDRPTLLPCGAFVSQRYNTVTCQACYGRRTCRCGKGTKLPCDAGKHMTPGARRAAANSGGRTNRGFVDVNPGRRGMSTAR